jgi:hypothetical protein
LASFRAWGAFSFVVGYCVRKGALFRLAQRTGRWPPKRTGRPRGFDSHRRHFSLLVFYTLNFGRSGLVRRRHGEPGSPAPTKELSCPHDTRAPLETRTQCPYATKNMKPGLTFVRRLFCQRLGKNTPMTNSRNTASSWPRTRTENLAKTLNKTLAKTSGFTRAETSDGEDPMNVEFPQNRRFQLPCLPPTTGENHHLNPAPPRIKPREKHPVVGMA